MKEPSYNEQMRERKRFMLKIKSVDPHNVTVTIETGKKCGAGQTPEHTHGTLTFGHENFIRFYHMINMFRRTNEDEVRWFDLKLVGFLLKEGE